MLLTGNFFIFSLGHQWADQILHFIPPPFTGKNRISFSNIHLAIDSNLSLKFSPLPRSFRLRTEIFLHFFFSEPNPKKFNIRRSDPSEREAENTQKKFLFSRAHKFYVYAKKQIWSFLSFIRRQMLKNVLISRIAFFIFSLMRIFHLFCSVCAVQSFKESEKLTFTLSWICDAWRESAIKSLKEILTVKPPLERWQPHGENFWSVINEISTFHRGGWKTL